MPFRGLLLSIFLTIPLSTAMFAQTDDTIKVESTIVRVNVGVVDSTGRPITSLDRGSFAVYEDGVKQDIARFDTVSAPFSVVMMLDMSGSTKSFRQNIQLSAARFLDALGPGDRVAVVEFYRKINLLNDFTTDRSLAMHSISVANGEGDTNLYKAVSFALDKLEREGNRRKAIVVLTDGVDTEAQSADRKLLSSLAAEQLPNAIKADQNENLARILNRADKMGATVYPLALPTGDPARLADPTPLQISLFKAARERLKLVADRTGGTLSAINLLDDMATLYAKVAADLRTLYTIEYQPLNDRRDGKWREIKVQVGGGEYIARSRQGYFAR
jgi:Ca-activated chloride channel homolog